MKGETKSCRKNLLEYALLPVNLAVFDGVLKGG